MAAGRGERVGAPQNGPKQYRLLGNAAVLAHTLRNFIDCGLFSKILVVIHPDDHHLCDQALGVLKQHVTIVEGGPTRQISTLFGLRALAVDGPDHVFIHDGARPFVSLDLLHRIKGNLTPIRGVLPAIAVTDTLKRCDAAGTVVETVARSNLYGAQTPQAFPFLAILQAHENAHQHGFASFTDDSALAEWADIPVHIVEGDPANLKITWPDDIITATARITKETDMASNTACEFPDIRTGNGYDVHSFEPGDHVTLCGVDIEYDRKLNGHSDADVALHALTDALLATRGAGDIGTHFPPSDPQWKGASSDIFVRHAVSIVRQAGGRIINADITLIAEAPKIGPHRQAMTEKLMEMLGVSADRISIKATTNEKMGFVGRKEGIAAIATANVVYPGEVPL